MKDDVFSIIKILHSALLTKQCGAIELEYSESKKQWRKSTLLPLIMGACGIARPMSRYIGKLKDGKPDGYGELFFSVPPFGWNIVYCGMWKNGRFNGKGKYEWTGGSHSREYFGDFKDGLKHGHGHETWLSGEYRGWYDNDEMCGEAISTW